MSNENNTTRIEDLQHMYLLLLTNLNIAQNLMVFASLIEVTTSLAILPFMARWWKTNSLLCQELLMIKNAP